MRKILIVFLLIFLVSFISGATEDKEFSWGKVKQGDCITWRQGYYNSTYTNFTSVTYPNKTQIFLNPQISGTNHDGEYEYVTCNYSDKTGEYEVCSLTDVDGVPIKVCNNYLVTPNGEEATVGAGIFYLGLLVVLVIFLVGTVTIFMETENLLAKVGTIGLGYILLIAITFIGWNMASDFLTSSPFLVSVLRILFISLMVGAFPLLIGSFAWYVLLLFKIKEIERLMGKGFSYEDAERRASRRKK